MEEDTMYTCKDCKMSFFAIVLTEEPTIVRFCPICGSARVITMDLDEQLQKDESHPHRRNGLVVLDGGKYSRAEETHEDQVCE
jgi:uncharacterized Zn finger protein (UPF0148 family)